MSTNQLVAPSVEAPALPISWMVRSKAGDVLKYAHCATSQAFAPKAARLADGMQKDLTQLINGQYRPVLSSVSAKLSAKDIKTLFVAGVAVSLASPSKRDMVPFATAIIKLWGGLKGEKLAIATMLQQYVNAVTDSLPAPTTPAPETEPAPF